VLTPPVVFKTVQQSLKVPPRACSEGFSIFTLLHCFRRTIMFRNRCTWFSIALISVLAMVAPQVLSQGFVDNFNRPDQAGPPEDWTAFRGEWTITDGSLVGESSDFDNNPLREAWIWAGQPPVELSSDLELSFDMNFLTDSNVGDRNGRHAGVFFCSSRPTHRWDRAGGINGYCLDWIDRVEDRGIRLVRIDGGDQTVLRNAGGELRSPPLHWRVALDAATIRVWGDDELVMEVEDDRHRGGHLGFWVWSNGTRVAYDNVMTGNAALLPLGEQRTVQLQPGVDGEDTAAFYFTAHREAGAPGNTIVFSLDGQEGDENALLMAWGRVPTKNDFDLAADARGQADQRLVIPFARDDLAYVVPYAKRGGGREGNEFNSVILQAELPGILLDGLSVESAFRPSPGGSSGRVTTSVFGAGFTAETSFLFSGQAGAGIAVVETQFVSSNHVLLSLELGGRTLPGFYQLEARNGDEGSAQLQDAFLVEGGEVAPGVLEVSLIAAGEVRPFRLRPLQVRYSNIGRGSLAPRLLRIQPPAGVQLKLAGDYALVPPGVPVDILTVNSVGYPGSLPPGASGVQNLVYRVFSIPDPGIEGSEQLEFTVEVLSPRCLEAGPGCAPRLLTKPEDMPASAWARMGDVVGESLSDFISSLGELSTRVALRGGNPASVSEALRLAAHTAWTLEDPGNHFSGALSGVLRDSHGNPLGEVSVAAVRGAERACAVTGASGFFVIEGLQGGPGVYQLEAEGFSLSATGSVDIGGEASLGSVVAVGQANNSPFECEIFADSLQVAPLTTSPDRLVSVASVSVEIIIPIDPNYKSGTAGQSTVREVDLGEIVPNGKDLSGVQANVWIPYADDGVVSQEFDGRTIVYEITFENDENANGAAQKVDVFDCLPPELDWTTVRFLGAGVDDDYDCTSNTGISSVGSFNTEAECLPDSGGMTGNARFDIDLQADEDVDVKILCEQDENLLSWQFISLQAGTQVELDDDGQGFLQPHISGTSTGEAWVQFSVEIKNQKDALAPGTLIRNDATVVFKDLAIPVGPPEPGQVVLPQAKDQWDGLDCEGDGGAAGMGGNDDPGYVLTTEPVYHIIPQENYFPDGCDNGVDDDLDGLEDCDDDDCDTDEFCNPVGPLATFRRGDSNNDGGTDISDAITLFSYLFLGATPPPCDDAADANDDEGVDISDGIFVLYFLFQNGPAPEAPGASLCGEDPTADPNGDNLGCDDSVCQ